MSFRMVKMFSSSGLQQRSKAEVKFQKILKSNNSKTVQDWDIVSIEVRWEAVYELSNDEHISDLTCFPKVKGQGQTPKLWSRLSRKRYEIEKKCH